MEEAGQDTKKSFARSLKDFFTQEVSEPVVKEHDPELKTPGANVPGAKTHGLKSQDTKVHHITSESAVMDEKRKQLGEFIKNNPSAILCILFILLIPLGCLLYKYQASAFYILDLFIPFPLSKYSFVTFFIILPIVACILAYYKQYAYIALVYVINSGFAIRLQNLPLLKDITTGQYIAADPDALLYLRYAKDLVYGAFQPIDPLRYFPLGADLAAEETVFLSKFIVYIYDVLHFFDANVTIELADVIYPPICFAISLLFFFLIAKSLFNKKVAVLSTFLLAIAPSYLFRTMTGISDKESLALMFMYIALYFFIISWKSKTVWKTVVFGVVAGIATGMIGQVWGGVNFTLLLFAGFILAEIFLNKFTKNDFYLYLSWLVPVTFILGVISPKFGGLSGLVKSFTSGIAYLVFLIAVVDFVFFKLNVGNMKDKVEKKLPLGAASTLISLVLAVVGTSVFIHVDFVIDKFMSIFSDMINPFGKTRWAITVAESHQPYFVNLVSDYTWTYLALSFVGAVVLFYYALKPFSDKESFSSRTFMYSLAYGLFLLFFCMSRYAQENPVWNGETTISKAFYVGSFIAFIAVMVLSYLYLFYYDKSRFDRTLSIDKKYILITIWFIIMLVAARSALRLMLMLAPVTSIIVSFFIVFCITQAHDFMAAAKDKTYKYSLGVLVALLLIISFWPFASVVSAIPLVGKIPFINENGFAIDYVSLSSGQAKYTGSVYDQQWQLAGKWIRENTSKDAVFAHWWDYGYLVQTGGERATVGDGGNWIGYWNHLMGRHGLMAESETEALEFFNMHNVSHFLIVTDEIGKVGAYSSIGSDESYDRYTWIPTFSVNNKLTKETREGIVFVYEGVTPIDEDFEYNGVKYAARQAAVKDLYLPTKKVEVKAADGASKYDMQILQPYTLLFKNNEQPVQVPVSCLFYRGKFIRFDQQPGLNNCFVVIPSISNQGGLDLNGAGLYLGEDAVNSLWVNLYLFEQQNPGFSTSNFRLALDQQHPALVDINQQTGIGITNVALYNGRLFGPLKIWEVNYPAGLTPRPEYLLTGYEEANLTQVTVI